MPADNVQANRNALIGLKSLPDYMPTNRAYTVERLLEIAQEVERLREEEVRAVQTLAMLRDQAGAAEWEMHDGILGARAQVIAQYGPDSHAVQLLGLKRKSERKRTTRKAAASTEE
jgi:hypothetical protein